MAVEQRYRRACVAGRRLAWYSRWAVPAAPAHHRRRIVVANIKSQKKRNLTNLKARERNKAVKSELKTRVKAALHDAETGTDQAGESLRLAQKRLDKAASKGVIHKNQAARRKSRLMKSAALAGAPEADADA
jgi:small subunit ribosomal protein S20